MLASSMPDLWTLALRAFLPDFLRVDFLDADFALADVDVDSFAVEVLVLAFVAKICLRACLLPCINVSTVWSETCYHCNAAIKCSNFKLADPSASIRIMAS